MRKFLALALSVLGLAFSAPAPVSAQQVTNGGQIVQGSSSIRGPIPWADVTRFGARYVFSPPTTTATCTSSTMACTLANGANFINGDGITLYGAGAAISMSTPGTPTATPSIATGGTGTGVVVNSGTGSSTYLYEVIARDKFGGLTAASASPTFTTGLASLGETSCTITTMALSNNSITVNTSSSCAAAQGSAGGLVHIQGSTNGDFTGWWNIATINSATQFVLTNTGLDSRGLGGNVGDSTSASGGTARFFLCNHLSWAASTGAWEYYIYAKRPGDSVYHLIGQTHVSNGGYIDNTFDDFGSTFDVNQTYPSYVPATPPASTYPDPLTTTIATGGGTNSITIANPVVTSVIAQGAVFDDAPGIKAAYAYLTTSGATSAPGTLYFPGGMVNGADYGLFINSYLSFQFPVTILQIAPVTLNETMEFQSGVTWSAGISNQLPQFSTALSSIVNVAAANPGIYSAAGGGITVDHIGFYTNNTNGGTLWTLLNTYATFTNSIFSVNAQTTNDYTSMAFVFQSVDSAHDDREFFKVCSFLGGDGATGEDSTWTPLVFMPIAQNGSGSPNASNILASFQDSSFSLRGIEMEHYNGGADFVLKNVLRQGGITPLVAIGGSFSAANGSVYLENIVQDTDASGTVAMWSKNAGQSSVNIEAHVIEAGSVDSGSSQAPPPFTGAYTTHIHIDTSVTGKPMNRESWSNLVSQAVIAPYDIAGSNPYGVHDLFTVDEAVHHPSQYAEWWDLFNTTTVTVTGPTSSGTLAVGTWNYAISLIDPIQQESVIIPGAATCVTTAGNQTCAVSWTPVIGAPLYDAYACFGSGTTCINANGTVTFELGNWRRIVSHTSTTSFTDSGSFGVGPVPPSSGTAGLTISNLTGDYALQFKPVAVPVASLPSVSTSIGQMHEVNDSTAVSAEGQTCTGGSSHTALAFSDGSNWKCF